MNLTRDELALIALGLKIGGSFKSFYEYFKNTILTQHGFIEGPHHKMMCDKIEAVMRGDIKRLMMFAPPRTGKTIMTANAASTYYLSKNPQKEIVIACYGEDYAVQDVQGSRLQLENEFHKKVFPDQNFRINRSDAWSFHQKRGKDPNLRGVGIGSALTGSGADILIIDDYIKDAASAFSMTTRNTAWDWYTHVAATRLNPMGNGVIIIATPWHPDDLAHRLLKLEGEKGVFDENGKEGIWDVVRIRAIDESGRSFWPERFTDEFFAEHLNRLGPESFSALYLGRPVAEEGAKFGRDWWQFYDIAEIEKITSQNIYVYASWDTALKDKEMNDYTACSVWLSTPNGHYLLDTLYERLQFTDLEEAVHRIHKKWNVMYHLIEDKASGISLIQTLKRNTMYNIIPIEPKGPKYERIVNTAPVIRGGRVFLPAEFATYQGELVKTPTQKSKFIIEMFALYPFVDHDDMHDSIAQYLNFINVNTVKGVYASLSDEFYQKSAEYEVF